MSRNAEMKLPEQKDKGKIYTLKPLPTFSNKEKLIKQRDGDFIVVPPQVDPEAAQKKLFEEAQQRKNK